MSRSSANLLLVTLGGAGVLLGVLAYVNLTEEGAAPEGWDLTPQDLSQLEHKLVERMNEILLDAATARSNDS